MSGSTQDLTEQDHEPDRAPGRERSRGRYCRVCDIELSAYNPNPYCWQHMIGQPWRGPTAKPKF